MENLENLTKRQLWKNNNKQHILEYARQHYIKKVSEDPTYRDKIYEKMKLRNIDKLKKPIGRPKKIKEEETKEKKKAGRPKKY